MVEAVSYKLILAKVSILRLLCQEVSKCNFLTTLKEKLDNRVICLLVEQMKSWNSTLLVKLWCQDAVSFDLQGAGGTLVTFEFSREKEEAIVAHEVITRAQLDKLHSDSNIQLRHLLLLNSCFSFSVNFLVLVAF